jgi:hypothetical protein
MHLSRITTITDLMLVTQPPIHIPVITTTVHHGSEVAQICSRLICLRGAPSECSTLVLRLCYVWRWYLCTVVRPTCRRRRYFVELSLSFVFLSLSLFTSPLPHHRTSSYTPSCIQITITRLDFMNRICLNINSFIALPSIVGFRY